MRGKVVNFCMALLNLVLGLVILIFVFKIPREITELTVQEYKIVNVIKLLIYICIGLTTFLNVVHYFLNSRSGMRKTGYLIAVFSVSFIFIKEWPISIFCFLAALIIITTTLRERWIEVNSITAISIIGIIAAICVVSGIGCLIYKSLGLYILNKQNENELAYKEDYFKYIVELDIDEPYINVKKDDKYGYITPNGNVVIDFKYDYASPFVPITAYNKNFQIALVCENESTEIILKNERKVMTYRSQSMDKDYEAKQKELEDVYYNELNQTEKMHYEVDTNYNNSYVAKMYNRDEESNVLKFNYSDEYDVVITQSSLGFGDTYELVNKSNPALKIKLDCEHLAYDENYLYVFSNGNIPFYDTTTKKQGWFNKNGVKTVLGGRAQILEIIDDKVLIKNYTNNTIYFIEQNNKSEAEPISDIYKEIYICGRDRFIVKNSKNKYMVINSNFEKVFESEWDFVDTSLVSVGIFVFGTSKDAVIFNEYDYAENMDLTLLDFDGNVIIDNVKQCYNKYYYISNDKTISYSDRYNDFLDALKVMKYKFFGEEFYK